MNVPTRYAEEIRLVLTGQTARNAELLQQLHEQRRVTEQLQSQALVTKRQLERVQADSQLQINSLKAELEQTIAQSTEATAGTCALLGNGS